MENNSKCTRCGYDPCGCDTYKERGEVYPGVSWEQYERDRDVARWVQNGKPNVEKKELQQWLIKFGYEHYIPEDVKIK